MYGNGYQLEGRIDEQLCFSVLARRFWSGAHLQFLVRTLLCFPHSVDWTHHTYSWNCMFLMYVKLRDPSASKLLLSWENLNYDAQLLHIIESSSHCIKRLHSTAASVPLCCTVDKRKYSVFGGTSLHLSCVSKEHIFAARTLRRIVNKQYTIGALVIRVTTIVLCSPIVKVL